MYNKSLITKTIVRSLCMVFLAFAIYKKDLDGAFSFIFTLVLGFYLFPWAIDALRRALFGSDDKEYDGVLYVDRTQANDIYNLSLNIDPEDFILKSELKIKIDDMEGT